MKKIFVFTVIVLGVLSSCNQSVKKGVKKEVVNQIAPITIPQVMEIAEQNIGKTVFFKGMVEHVCAHSGRRCILSDESGKLSLRVEAKGDIKGFNRELAGSVIAIKGILQENKLSQEYINDWEEKLKAKQDVENGGESCSSEMTNIQQMRDWMKKNNKEFYSIYFVNGTSYEILD